MERIISNETAPNQGEYIKHIKLKNIDCDKKAMIVTYGCAQNETDSDKLYGMLFEMGYTRAQNPDDANLIIFNTCSVRENAEIKVYGKIGALKAKKKKKDSLIIGICGCLMQQGHASEKIRKSFPFVDMIFGTHAIHNFPQLLYETMQTRKNIMDVEQTDGFIAEGVPTYYGKKYKASIPIVLGCNNFCTYCVVPLTRGRERSRNSRDILAEIERLCQNGLKEVTLLGQNVNSYGNKGDLDFPDLLLEIAKIDSIKRIRFLTSHPKDLTDKLIQTMAGCDKICKSLHLPFQAGNNRILKEMNRKYTREDYLALVEKIKTAMPNIALTADVIVGFPGETDQEFLDTMDIVEKVRFDTLFTFIYSRRKDTKAALMEDHRTHEEKLSNFNVLLETQTRICKEINDTYVGNLYEIIDEGISKTNLNMRHGRTETNKIINYKAKSEINEGDFVKVRVTESMSWSLNGVEA